MKRELAQEREQADERLVKRMKLEKAPTFKRKSHEVQYTFNEEVKAKFDSVKAALHAVGDTSRGGESQVGH